MDFARRKALLLIALVGMAACAPRRPVLYPNEQLTRGGTAAAERDIDDCMRRAEQYVSKGDSGAEVAGQVAGETAVGAGAAVGAVGGAIVGSAGQGGPLLVRRPARPVCCTGCLACVKARTKSGVR